MDLYDIAIARKLSDGGGGGGGGGDSDFSTAQVTIVAGDGEIQCLYPNLLDIEGVIGAMIIDRYIVSGVYTMPLYKGNLGIKFLDSPTITITGNAMDGGHGDVMITGDCTITIS